MGATVGMENSPVNPSLLPGLHVTSVLQVSVSLPVTGEDQIETTAVTRMVMMAATSQALSASICFAEGFYTQYLI